MQSLLIISLFIIAISSLISLFADSREGNDERVECDGYRKIEIKKTCGKNGYLIHYGLPNCQQFSRAVEKGLFDEKGAEWVKCTTECLIDKLFEIHQSSPSLSCSSLEEKAFNTHVPCYLECHFCEVCRSQKWGLIFTYRFRDFLNLNSISQVYDVISECGLFHCFT
ncbi:hypothetical protein PENTCL1PPCAC_22926 [Pristionchus entomophagus]|uniref:Uncharacterized protein n=1 Tax=Pristionchus entomophagus TaxID=358040 RepID=A0AAV5U2M4_9BILA|nr:hypothetical protein PENTCL1PPCAC_22926 [Pristionchus entomophagus]